MQLNTAYVPNTFHHLITAQEIMQIPEKLKRLDDFLAAYGSGGDAPQIGAVLDVELRRQHLSFMSVGDAAAEARSLADGLKLTLDSVMALAEMQTRTAYEDDDVSTLPLQIGGHAYGKLAKATEAVIAAAVKAYDLTVLLTRCKIEAELRSARLAKLEFGWRDRGFNLRTLAERESAQLHSTDYTRAQNALADTRNS